MRMMIALVLRRMRNTRRKKPAVVLAMPEIVPGGGPVVLQSSAITELELSQVEVAGTTTGSPKRRALGSVGSYSPPQGESMAARLISTAEVAAA